MLIRKAQEFPELQATSCTFKTHVFICKGLNLWQGFHAVPIHFLSIELENEWGQLICCHMQFECRIEHLVPDSLICFLCLTFMLHLAENKHNSALLEVVAATYLHPVLEVLEGACNCACDVAMGREVEGCNPLPSRGGKRSIENKPGLGMKILIPQRVFKLLWPPKFFDLEFNEDTQDMIYVGLLLCGLFVVVVNNFTCLAKSDMTS